jgi:hypothetical protein
MLAQELFRPMSEFDPLEPALLHDRLKDQIIPGPARKARCFVASRDSSPTER